MVHEVMSVQFKYTSRVGNGMFPLPDSDSYTDSDSDSYEIGFNDNVQNCFH